MAEDILAFVMAGGMGGRLQPLTAVRAKPAVPFGAVYRIIDFPLSNCINSDIRQIFVLTQYKSQSLSQHLHAGWNFLSRRLEQFIDEIPAQMQLGQHWYEGTADAIRQNMRLVETRRPNYVLVLPGDHIYKMDYRFMKRFHQERKAVLTIATIRVNADVARNRYGVLEVAEDGRVTGFEEKPDSPKTLPDGEQCVSSMGIYLFSADKLREVMRGTEVDFSREMIPRMVAEGQAVYAYDFEAENWIQENEYRIENGMRIKHRVDKSSDAGYWRDVGTIDSFWRTNLDLVSPHPSFNLYGEKWPIFNSAQHFPPAKFVHEAPGRTGHAVNSIVTDGVILSGSHVRNSVLAPGIFVHSYALVESCVLFGGTLMGTDIVETTIGRNCRIRNAIIDKNVRIEADVLLGYDRGADDARGLTTHGIPGTDDYIVVVPKGMVVR